MTPPEPPAPPISIVSFSTNNTVVTPANFTITANAPDELVVSGTCQTSEDGHTIEVVGEAVVGTTNGVITSITNTSSCTKASTGDSATWTTTFTEDNLNSLRTNNMRTSFQASITNDAGGILRATPQALFVEPDIAPSGNLNGFYNIVFEDIHQIGDTCRLVLVGNVTSATAFFVVEWWGFLNGSNKKNIINSYTLQVRNNILQITENLKDGSSLGLSYESLPTTVVSSGGGSLVPSPFTVTIYVDINSNENSYRFRFGGLAGTSDTQQTYRYCGVGPVPSN